MTLDRDDDVGSGPDEPCQNAKKNLRTLRVSVASSARVTPSPLSFTLRYTTMNGPKLLPANRIAYAMADGYEICGDRSSCSQGSRSWHDSNI